MIPATHKELSRFIEQHRASWPQELTDKALRAKNALWTWEAHPPRQQDHQLLIQETAKDLMAFAEAYGAWRADTAR